MPTEKKAQQGDRWQRADKQRVGGRERAESRVDSSMWASGSVSWRESSLFPGRTETCLWRLETGAETVSDRALRGQLPGCALGIARLGQLFHTGEQRVG